MTRRKQRSGLPRTRTTAPAPTPVRVNPADTTHTTATGAYTQAQVQQLFSGPLPPPALLREYEEILPGFAERLLSDMERQSAHRQELERRVIIGDGRRAWAGIICAFLLALAFLIAGVYLGITRHDPAGPILGGTLGVGGLAGLIGTFIYGTNSRRDERVQKARVMTGQAAPHERR